MKNVYIIGGSPQMIEDAQTRIREMGCFVAGTLVHTQTGLRPIEEIKVGDYVLSKPENAIGEPSYKRVTKTFEYDDKEVWYVSYSVVNADYSNMPYDPSRSGFFVATGNHPIWVKAIDKSGQITPINRWVSVADLAMDDDWADAMRGEPIFELADGRVAKMSVCEGLLAASDMPDIGIGGGGFEFIMEQGGGSGVDFSDKVAGPQRVYDVYLNNIDDADTYDYENAPAESVGARVGFGYPPYLSKVYNLEVEDNHTYYVNQLGVWVHNTSASVLARRLG